MGKGTSYKPLDVELDFKYDGVDQEGPRLQGWDAPVPETPADRRRARITAIAFGAVFAALLVAVIATSSPSTPVPVATSAPAAAAGGVWNEHGGAGDHHESPPAAGGAPSAAAGLVPCKGLSDLECKMVNPRPLPDRDFRDLPRRLEAAGGVVAADSSRCSEVGAGALAEGGHAVDAAVATALCLGVVNPISSGLGGGAFILIRLANGSSELIDAREPAPAAATANMFDDKDKYASLDGGLAVAVPCELRGLEAAWRRYGRLPWRRLVEPAAALARSGYAAHPYLIYTLTGPYNFARVKSIPALRDAFLIRNGTGPDDWRAPAAGELCCRRPKLAATLDAIAEHGADWMYTGEVAEKLAAEVQAAGGIMTKADLEGVQPAFRQTLTAQLGGLDLVFPPPPSSAAVVAFGLRFLAGYKGTLLSGEHRHGDGDDQENEGEDDANGGKKKKKKKQGKKQRSDKDGGEGDGEEGEAGGGGRRAGPDSGEGAGRRRRRRLHAQRLMSFGVDPERDGGKGLQRLIEAQKHGFAVRTALGDPGAPGSPFAHADEINAAVADLLDDDFTESLRKITRDKHVLDPTEYGGRWNPIGRGAPPDDHGTTHFNVVDRDRNAVSITSTVNTVFGSGVVSDSTGIVLNNEMDDFSQPNRTSLVTPHPSPANFIAPGKRPLSAMSPFVAADRATGRLVAVTGGSGGPLIVSATLQTLARLLLEGADVSDAVAATRLHDQLLPLPTKTFFEGDGTWFPSRPLPPHVVEELEGWGQDLEGQRFGLGVSQAIVVKYDDEGSDAGDAGGDAGGEGDDGGGEGGDGGDQGAAGRRRLGGGGGARGVLVAMSDARKDGAPFAAR